MTKAEKEDSRRCTLFLSTMFNSILFLSAKRSRSGAAGDVSSISSCISRYPGLFLNLAPGTVSDRVLTASEMAAASASRSTSNFWNSVSSIGAAVGSSVSVSLSAPAVSTVPLISDALRLPRALLSLPLAEEEEGDSKEAELEEEEEEECSSETSLAGVGTLRDVVPHTVRKHSMRGMKRIVSADKDSSIPSSSPSPSFSRASLSAPLVALERALAKVEEAMEDPVGLGRVSSLEDSLCLSKRSALPLFIADEEEEEEEGSVSGATSTIPSRSLTRSKHSHSITQRSPKLICFTMLVTTSISLQDSVVSECE